MQYKEYAPDPELTEFVECYWRFVVGPGNIPINHVFPPDASCNLLFAKSGVAQFILFSGPSVSIREITVYPETVYLGIRLKPGCSAFLHQAEPALLKDTSIILDPGETAAWQNQILSMLTPDFDIVPYLNWALLAIKAKALFSMDERVAKAINFITAHDGNIVVKTIADHVCMSNRQLERVFFKTTGITIKRFAQLRRLRKALIDLLVDDKNQTQMVVDWGYADSPHFYKTFRKITGYSFSRFQQHIRLIENDLI